MKKIKLTQDKYALVDDLDFDDLDSFKWFAKKDKGNFYAARHSSGGTRKLIFMHRLILLTPDELFTDHKDGNGLNNQRKNLRNCTNQQNSTNRGKNKNNTSGFKGVSWAKTGKNKGKWRGIIAVNGKSINLGLFCTKEEAYVSYCRACQQYHGEYSHS